MPAHMWSQALFPLLPVFIFQKMPEMQEQVLSFFDKGIIFWNNVTMLGLAEKSTLISNIDIGFPAERSVVLTAVIHSCHIQTLAYPESSFYSTTIAPVVLRELQSEAGAIVSSSRIIENIGFFLVVAFPFRFLCSTVAKAAIQCMWKGWANNLGWVMPTAILWFCWNIAMCSPSNTVLLC